MAKKLGKKTVKNDEEIVLPDYILKLIEGYSMYNKVSIKYWTLIAFISIVVITPAEQSDGKIQLPLELTTIAKENFYPLCFIIISLLVICFGSAFAQAFSTARLFHNSMEELKLTMTRGNQAYLKRITDGLIYPSLTRVGPLATLLKERLLKRRFLRKRLSMKYINGISKCYYVFIKFFSVSVMYLLPAYALFVSFFKGIWNSKEPSILNIPVWSYYILLVPPIIIILHLLWEDFYFIGNVSTVFGRDKDK